MSATNQTTTDPIVSELVREDPSFADIVVQFVEGLSDRVTTMEQAVRAADFDALRTAAHQLKGSGTGYGYPILTQRAGELEQHAINQAMDDCANLLADLKQICSRVIVGENQ